MSEQRCDQCQNHCPIDELRCNRGRVHFGQEPVEPKLPAGPIGLLQRCGSMLHHGSISPEDALSALTTEEQAELECLLSTLLEDWKKREPQGHAGHRHGHSHGHS